MKPKDEYRYVAYDAHNAEYEQFKTIKEAEDWLKENDGNGISEEAVNGFNFIAEIQYISVVEETDNKSNYHVHNDECGNDCEEEEWPYDDEFSWVGNHRYEKIEWE